MFGRIKRVVNVDRRFGADPAYLFLKVAWGPAEWQEEHWLVTDGEDRLFTGRGISYPRIYTERLGKVVDVDPKYGNVGVAVRGKPQDGSGGDRLWILTQHDVEQIRRRAESNREDIEANREGWLRDLLD